MKNYFIGGVLTIIILSLYFRYIDAKFYHNLYMRFVLDHYIYFLLRSAFSLINAAAVDIVADINETARC